ncbi:tRNA (N(6)-L-threonylcarbamoyladenosine(37)-C(2))-methylthiotransferase MtaB [Suipraeoptans intestinalis]|uniref:tRNA (N(6)-L-threonylcarbamoyladenosine(37)-C(2))- methylthiotransferase MtaB n=1 Tax=Suipraeoptans intestinalis TaxID=2606628 RepID=UPI0023F44B98|nr:tRNA (N(6)-L-threonylcarbamoyladenosine(37)-C(2))-methylthiotransferase MtaB [Suipraeoptans intestinalis]MDD7770156.1 tRNA (N(6)-L-threonylcarbamoyladenosine(37)-C(2))-methylthiotransferase MtaB [Suipraeoptans intestinalis]
MKKAALHNLGCKVNAYETEAIQQMLEKEGYEIVPFREGADIYIINTCTVTNVADRKSRQMLHRARKMNPEAIVVACGCYVQTEQKEIDDCIDIVVGNNRKKDILSILKEYEQSREESTRLYQAIPEVEKEEDYEELSIRHTTTHTRAYMKIQDGCNQFCSYCIIPFARGRVRSRKRAQIEEEARQLVQSGCKEIVLTGIHLSSYGLDTGDTLIDLMESLHQIEGLLRIRLGSLEPRIITEEFVSRLVKLEKVCPHFHLSLQSGCDATLKRMNRRYDTGEYREKCQLLRRFFAEPALTTDIIVGFPGETEEEFAESKRFVDEMDFYETHVFKYSKREGTRAASMAHQVPDGTKADRSSELLELNRKKKQNYESRLLGTTQEVLIEEEVFVNEAPYQVGHTREYVKVGVQTREDLTNRLIPIEIKDPAQIMGN